MSVSEGCVREGRRAQADGVPKARKLITSAKARPYSASSVKAVSSSACAAVSAMQTHTPLANRSATKPATKPAPSSASMSPIAAPRQLWQRSER